MEENSQIVLSFASISGKSVEADFEGGTLTSDGGALLLRWVESGIGVIGRLSEALRDRRHPSYVDHPLLDLLRQRVFQIACGYEDANDSNTLRVDPAFKAAVDRLPLSGEDLASQPTMTRLENSVSRSDLYRMARALVDTFIASYEKPPKAILLDIDDTDDPTHGAQQMSLFNAYYDEKCYQPLHIYEGQTGKLITTILRPGRRPTGVEIVAILKRVVAYLRQHWPQVSIFLRGDSHFSTPEVHDFCRKKAIRFALGQGGNARLDVLAAPLLEQARSLYQAQQKPVRLFSSFAYQADTWSTPQRVICKVEVSDQGTNVRFVTTNVRSCQPSFIYRTIYCGRGRMENFIKNHKTFLHSDRTSCHTFQANQFRLLLHSAAYVLLHTLAEKALPSSSPWHNVYFDTIQKRLLKVGARVRELRTKVRFHFPTSFPLQELYAQMVAQLASAFP